MKKYFPLLSVAAAAVAVLCPLAIIAWNSLAGETTSTASPETPPPAARMAEGELEQQLHQLLRRVDALEATVADWRPRTPAAAAPFFPLATNEAVVAPPTFDRPELPERDEPTPPKPAAETSSLTDQPSSTPPAESPPPVEAVTNVQQVEPAEVVEDASAIQTVLDSLTLWTTPRASATPISSSKAGPVAQSDTATKPREPPASRESAAKTQKAKRTRASTPSKEPTDEEQEVSKAMQFLHSTAEQAAQAERDAVSFRLAIVRPTAGSTVRQTEDLFASTPELGWPVVLVRSEIDGDHWWVQQLVTRRGTGIAARVNFGNTETIPGQVFELLVLMLDTEGEAIRFRTARKFDELPVGIRKSQIFRFTRR